MALKISGALKAGTFLLLLAMQAGCATSYDDLITKQGLTAANCSELATEESKHEGSVKALNDAGAIGPASALSRGLGSALTQTVRKAAAADGNGTYAFPTNSTAVSTVEGPARIGKRHPISIAEKGVLGRIAAERGCS